MNCPYCLKEMKKGGVKVIDTSNNMYSSVLWYPVKNIATNWKPTTNKLWKTSHGCE